MLLIRHLLFSLLLAFALPTMASAQVDINSADAKTLAESLSGIGLVRAEAIVAYRSTNGPFRAVEDLCKVRGIGKKTLEANRSTIVIIIPSSDRGSRSTTRPAAPT